MIQEVYAAGNQLLGCNKQSLDCDVCGGFGSCVECFFLDNHAFLYASKLNLPTF